MIPYRELSIPEAPLVSGSDFALKRELKDLNERRDLVLAALRRNSSKRPWFLVRWVRIVKGECPVCRAKIKKDNEELLGDYIHRIRHRFCPVDKGHYHVAKKYKSDFW